MSDMIDKRKKTAHTEQEYAHQYPIDGKVEDYAYPDEDKRVKFHVDSDVDDSKSRDQLYGIDPNGEYNVETTPNKIRVRMKKEDILEDHRQQSYKIRTKPQVYDKTDHGLESNKFQLEHDPHEQEVQFIKQTTQDFQTRIEEEYQRDLTSPNERYIRYKNDDSEEEKTATSFSVGMKVAHIEEGISGEVKFVNDKRVTVAWEDNTRERFSLDEAREFLSYVSDAQTQVSPTQTTPFPKQDLHPVVEKALTALEGDEVEEETEKTAKIDIEKAKLQREVNTLKNEVVSRNIQKVKEKATNELIDLMQKKGILGQSNEEVEKQFSTIMSMDDIAFEAFKGAILGVGSNKENEVDEIYALLEDNVDDDIEIEDGQEFAKAREEMKKASTPKRTVDGIEMGDTSFFENGGLAGFKGTIGDFSSGGSSSSPSTSSRQTETRNLASAAQKRTVQRTASERRENNSLDFSGFQNLQGITQPINIPAKETTAGTKFSELFSSMDWTVLSKK